MAPGSRSSSDDMWGVSDAPPEPGKPSEPPDPLVGQDLLGKLRVLRLIAGGGMGAVYEVEHLITGHRRALKVLRSKYVNVPQSTERLMREASVAGTLATPHVPETYDAGFLEDGSAYVLMELLDGRPLLDLYQERGRLGISHVCGLMVQVCEGLEMAHDAGIIHRDLKPENIFVVEGEGSTEEVKILDFGIAKFTHGPQEAPSRLTADGTILGTPYYMSPEQAMGGDVDLRTDVYAVGVMIYEAVTGMLPFDGPSVGAVFAKIQTGDYTPLSVLVPNLDPQFEAVVRKAMSREAVHRFPSAEAVRQALLPFAPSDTVSRGRTIPDAVRGATLDYQSGKAKRALKVDRDSETIAVEELDMPGPPRGAGGIRPPPPPPPPTPLAAPPRIVPGGGAVEPISDRPHHLQRVGSDRAGVASVSPEPDEQPNRRLVTAGLGLLIFVLVGAGVAGLTATMSAPDGLEATETEQSASTGSEEPSTDEPQRQETVENAPEQAESARLDAGVGAQTAEAHSETERPPHNGTSMAGSTMMRTRTPAEEAGLELNPYNR